MDLIEQFWKSHADVMVGWLTNIGMAIVILTIALYFSNLLRKTIASTLMKMPQVDRTLAPVAGSLAKYLVILLALMAILDRFGVDTSSLIALLGAAGLAIALSLKDTLQHIASGLILLFLRPFRIGEYIEADDVAGTVEVVDLFTSTLRTADGICVTVPNGKLWGPAIRNYSRNATRRFDIEVGIAYRDDIAGARTLLLAMLKEDPRVQGEPEPMVFVSALGDSAVVLNVRGWTRIEDFWQTRWDLTQRAKERVEAAGYSIPFPQQDLHLVSADGLKAPTSPRLQ